jgi:DNA replication protein DnaC
VRVPGFRQVLTEAHLTRMGIPKRRWDVKTDRVPEPARTKIAGYVQHLDEALDQARGLFLWGENGTGKTSAMTLLAMECRSRGASVLFTTAEGLRTGLLKDAMFDSEQSLWDRAQRVDVLFVDELAKEHAGGTDHWRRSFEALLRERSGEMRTTFMAGNVTPKTLGTEKVYLPSTIALMNEVCYPVQVVGPSQRTAGDVKKWLGGEES